jgi:multiple sugar transport system substrate-binding protein
MTKDLPLRGLTWDHPRGHGPLEALDAIDRRDAPEVRTATALRRRVQWRRQPLEGFESTPLAELAEEFDILIIDHPHIADAVDNNALVPLDELFEAEQLAEWRVRTVGPSFDSYTYRGQTWALSIDAATQVMAARESTPMLDTWEDVAEFAADDNTLLCVAGPHAFSTIISILVGMGEEPAGAEEFAEQASLIDALEFLRFLRSRTINGLDRLNPIQALTAMTAMPQLAVIPLVYGYVNFATGSAPLQFQNAPAWSPHGRRGAVLGGTGFAITPRGSSQSADILDHARRLMDETLHSTLVPSAGGQPSAARAWESGEVNNSHGDFYRATRQTMDDSWVRPRRAGWQNFYDQSSCVVREVLSGAISPTLAAEEILRAYRTLPAIHTTLR